MKRRSFKSPGRTNFNHQEASEMMRLKCSATKVLPVGVLQHHTRQRQGSIAALAWIGTLAVACCTHEHAITKEHVSHARPTQSSWYTSPCARTQGVGGDARGTLRGAPLLCLRGGLENPTDMIPSLLWRSPRDSMSLARREMNARRYSKDGFPDLSITDEHRRLIHDEVVQWEWLQCRLRCKEPDPDAHGAVRTREYRVAMSEEEINDFAVLHYLIVEARADEAAAFISLVGLDGTPYIRSTDPLEQTRVRPLSIDKKELLDFSLVAMRKMLREAVETGDMAKARRIVHHELGPKFWAGYPELLFRLFLQRFVELVKVGKYGKAVKFSQQQIAPFVEANPGYLTDLERVFGVLSIDHQAPLSHPDKDALWLLSKERRYELFRDINDAILRELGFDTMDMIQECQWLHSYYDEVMRRVEHAAAAQLALDPRNSTSIACLDAVKSWRSSLLSLEDILHERVDGWRDLMKRVQHDKVQPDYEIQGVIDEVYRKMVARESGEVGEGAGDTLRKTDANYEQFSADRDSADEKMNCV